MPVYPNQSPRNFQSIIVGKIGAEKEFFLPDGYDCRELKELGSGTFGTVIRVKRAGAEVAIKKFKTPMVDERTAQLCFREIVLLKNLHHPNIVRIIDLYSRELDEIFLVMEYAGDTLQTVLDESRTIKNAVLRMENIPIVIRDIFNALQFLEANDVIHRDLKPSNIALYSNRAVLLDFGLSRTKDEKGNHTNQAGTTCYWAPEICILKDGKYSSEADVWSVGCILAELLIWLILFEKDAREMVKRWISLFGPIPSGFMDKVTDNRFKSAIPKIKVSSEDPYDFFLKRNKTADFSIPLHKEAFLSAVDLIGKCLSFEASSRITVQNALNHPFILLAGHPTYALPDLSAVQPLRYDDSQRSVEDWKQTVFTEIRNFEATEDTPLP